MSRTLRSRLPLSGFLSRSLAGFVSRLPSFATRMKASPEEIAGGGQGTACPGKPGKTMPLFGLPTLFVGLTSASPEPEAAWSPTSPLDGKVFDRASLGLADVLADDGKLRRRVLLLVGRISIAAKLVYEDHACIISGHGGRRTTPEWTVEPPGELPAPLPAPEEFLKVCDFCNKDLTGRDVYMYRGEMAFCSSGCREAVMPDDEAAAAAAAEENETFPAS